MTLDLSVVKRIAVQCGASTFQEHWQLHPYKFSFGPSEILAFAQAIYAMGAAEQKEKIEDAYQRGRADESYDRN